ncbi:hypothetical protein P3S67_000859 [Capsicum chacoense]
MTRDKVDVHQHGVAVDQKKSKIKIRGDVTPCLEAPLRVKEALEAELLDKRNGNLIKEVGKLLHPTLSLKRNWCPRDDEPNKTDLARSSESTNKKHNGVISKVAGSCVVDSFSQEISKSTGRFFYEAGIDFDATRNGWVDSIGRYLINILVYCPRGTIDLRSSDISSFNGNADPMVLFFEEVLEEVGVENVVRIVAYSTSACMMEAGKNLMEKRKTVFWTVDASHYLELMLQKLTKIEPIQEFLEKAKSLTQYIYSHATVLKLLRDSCPIELVKPSKIRSVVPFLTLETIVSQQKHLIRIFQSSEWHSSMLASSREGKRMADMVEDQSFWVGALMAVKAVIPLVKVIKLLNGTNKPQVGFIYDTVDQAKEAIKKEFRNEKSGYGRFWKATIISMLRGLITLQIDEYRMGRGTSHFGSFKDKLSNISPELWWSQYGVQFPELQKFAVRILSQTCNGASHYRLTRSLVETLRTEGMNPIEKQRLQDLVFVHCILQLQAFDPKEEMTFQAVFLTPWMIG